MTDAILFENNTGLLSFRQVYNEFITESRVYRRIFKGWRPHITVTLRNIGCLTASGYDYDLMSQLMGIINSARSAEIGVYIQPRYNASAPIQPIYYCELVSDINLQDGAEVNAFQVLELEFIGINLEAHLPVFLADTQDHLWIDETGNYYVDESGDYYILAN